MIRLHTSWLDPIQPDMRFDTNLNGPWASGATSIMYISISFYQSLLDFHLHLFKVKQFFHFMASRYTKISQRNLT